jgi:hypothetical protein
MREKYYTNRPIIGSEIILTIYIALKPLYVFKSGSVQIADLFLVLGFIWLFWRCRGRIVFRPHTAGWARSLLIFTIYTAFINGMWFVYMALKKGTISTSFLSSILFYAFNFFAVIVCVMIVNECGVEKAIEGAMHGCLIASLVILLGIILRSSSQFRNTSFFNNPNQLGFFAIIMLTFLCFFAKRVNKYEALIILLISSYALMMSLSKAGFISAVAMGFFFFISQKDRTVKQIIFKGGAILLLGAVVYMILYSDASFITNISIVRSLRRRVLNLMNENDSSLMNGRAYGRVLEMGINALWGMGEGAFGRFSVMKGYEIHSTYMNIIVSYGAIGTALSVLVFMKPLRNKGYTFRNLCCMSGTILYCISHNGIRNTLIWILFCILISVKDRQARAELRLAETQTSLDLAA